MRESAIDETLLRKRKVKYMTKISMPIDREYCFSWGVFEGIRELIQNAKDAEEFEGHDMLIEHFSKTDRLVITTKAIYVDPAKLLILGKTSKTDGTQRGCFGEGFVIGLLALLRKGFDVKFRNGCSGWTVSFERPDEGHPFAGNDLLTFKSKALKFQEKDFVVEVEGVTTDIWKALKTLFLFLDEPAKADVVAVTEGSLLLGAKYKGHLYARGIFVKVFNNLDVGYDIKNIQLDRDRRAVDEWGLHYKLGSMWNAAHSEHPEKFSNRLYNMVKSGCVESSQIKYHADEKLLASIRTQFEAEHGEASVPCTTVSESKDVAKFGGKPAMVSNALKELLEKTGISIDAAKKASDSAVVRRWGLVDLDATELEILERLQKLAPSLAVVTLAGDDARSALIDDKTVVGIDRRLLFWDYRKACENVATVEAARRGVTVIDVLLDCINSK